MKKYKVKKGALVYPFTLRYKTKTHRLPSCWEISTQYEGEDLFAVEDWAFTQRQILPDKDTRDKAVAEILANSGTQFDPEVVGAFVNCLDVINAICDRYIIK